MKNTLRAFFSITILLGCSLVYGQFIRTHDGSNNNLQHPEWGAVGTNQIQLVDNGFSDEVSEPAGFDRPNPRIISNAIFNQDDLFPDYMGLSDYAWAWGQFIDHDITLVGEDHNEPLEIAIPAGDPYFDPAGTGDVVIHMKRSAYDPSSGTGPDNPRAFPSLISSFIDASNVYGSDEQRARWLRSFRGGKLRMSAGNLLPFNTFTGEFDSDVDLSAPGMAMPFPFITKWFVAGDVRANENPLLTSLHTLFAREHDRICDDLAIQFPNWSDENLYQHARKMVGGMIQAICYEEWLPEMGVPVAPFTGYNTEVNPGIFNVFSAAAYRYGHSVINSTILRLDNDGNVIPEGNILLRDGFFNPNALIEVGGLDPYLKGMTAQVEQDFDCKMIHDLRNFLFGPPGAGGLDIASLNINRGRERGLPDYNTIRENIGLKRMDDFSHLSGNMWLNQVMENVFQDINNIDPWVGFLAEDHMSSALFGETVMHMMETQFMNLRDGDRFYYEADPGLSADELNLIKNTRLKDIILRNTGVRNIQDKVFLANSLTPVAQVEVKSLELEVYPNPVSGQFFINIAAKTDGTAILRVTDLLGNIIKEKEVAVQRNMNTFEFSLDHNLPKGIYQVSLLMDHRVGNQMIFKS